MGATRQAVAERTKTPTLQRSRSAEPVRAVAAATPIQTSSLRVSSPADPAEREAESVARRVVNLPDSAVRAPALPPPGPRSPYAARFAETIPRREPRLFRKAAGPEIAPGRVASDIASAGSGSPLPPSVRRFMEPRLGADLGGVRVHTGDRAAGLSRSLNARAFTVGNQVFFGRGRFRPETGEGRELIAHELVHTIQQGTVVQRSAEPVDVVERRSGEVQRFGVSDALDYFADKALNIPGFRMFTIVLGVNPINMSGVDRSPANILRAIVEFVPGGHQITQALDNHGVFDKVAAWAAAKIAGLGMVGSAFKTAIDQFLDGLSWSDALRPGDVWDRAKRIFTEPIDQLIDFVKTLAGEILGFIRDAILMPLARLAQNTRGYDLLRAVLGKDPISGEAVPQTAENLVGGFLKLIGENEIWENVKKANAIPRVFAWFNGAKGAVIGFVAQLPTLFVEAFKALEIVDLILVPRAFAKLVGVFGDFAVKFATWAGTAVWNLLEIVFDAVSPGALGYIKRTGAALKSILKNPLPFVGNLVRAAKLAFTSFGRNFLEHLKRGLIDWLTGSLPGVYIPRAFTLGEIVKFALSVLGLTWQNLRAKLARVVGEPAVRAMETGFDIVVTLVRDGPAAAWEKIKEQLTNLREMIVGGITDMVVDMVVQKAIPKLVSMFIPGAGFVSAILSIYGTIMALVQRLSRIVQVVASFLDSMVAIAAGQIAPAAARVESALAGVLSVAIGLFAGFANLGNVANWIKRGFEKARAPFDKALDAVADWIARTARSLMSRLTAGRDDRTADQKRADLLAAVGAGERLVREEGFSPEEARSRLDALRTRHRLRALSFVRDSDSDERSEYHVEGEVNPRHAGGRIAVRKTCPPRDIVRIDSFTARPGFRPSTREAIPIVRGQEDRRHIAAWQTMHERLKLAVNGKCLETVARTLTRLHSMTRFGHAPERKSLAAVKEAGKAYLLDQFNADSNLWAGPARENQERGREFAVAKRRVDEAIEKNDRALFNTNIAILEALWQDPDPDGTKQGFRNLVGMTIRRLRREFSTRSGGS